MSPCLPFCSSYLDFINMCMCFKKLLLYLVFTLLLKWPRVLAVPTPFSLAYTLLPSLSMFYLSVPVYLTPSMCNCCQSYFYISPAIWAMLFCHRCCQFERLHLVLGLIEWLMDAVRQNEQDGFSVVL